MSSFKDRRNANLAAHNESLREINAAKLLPSAKLVAPKSMGKKRAPAAPSRKSTRELPAPRVSLRSGTRQSTRLAGLVPGTDHETWKRKAEEDAEAEAAAARRKKMRVSGDLSLENIQIEGKKWGKGLAEMKKMGLGIPAKGAQPGLRTFMDEDVKAIDDQDLKTLRVRMSGLKLYDKFPVQDIKLTPQRIYSLTIHPTEDKALIFAGDKEGALGIFDASQEVPIVEDEYVAEPIISALNLHRRTISCLLVLPTDYNALYSASFDSSIRKLDLQKEKALEIFSPKDPNEDMPISAIDLSDLDPQILLFSTLDGRLGRHDARTAVHDADVWQLTDHKIGGFTLHPLAPHLVATASLDRTMRIWDLRMLASKAAKQIDASAAIVGEHVSRLSVSHASWSRAGHVATSSYDDSVKIFHFPDAASWKAGHALQETSLEPTRVPHNNQTGRWVTILKPHWQRNPQDGLQKLVIGNMNRFVDVYSATGKQLAQLDGEGITAVPAVAQFHPTKDWVAGGTASGKLCLWT